MQLNQFVPNISLEERTLKRVRERKGTFIVAKDKLTVGPIILKFS